MSDIGLALAGLARKKLRTALMMFCVFIAFLIFAVLASFQASLGAGNRGGPANRLIAMNRISQASSLPIAYAGRIARIEGVSNVSYAQWFGGYYKETRNAVASYAVDAESFMRVSPDLALPEDQKQAFITNRDGLLIGRDLANQYGWAIGQQIPFSTNIWQRADGSYTWPVVIRGIYDRNDAGPPTNTAYLHYDYFDDARAWSKNQMGMVIIAPKDPSLNEPVIAAIRSQFENSSVQVKAVTEAAYRAAFVTQRASIGTIVLGVTGASFFTIILVVGTSMAGSIRERIGEIAVMKTIGFKSGRIARIVIGETMLVALVGGLAGLALAFLLIGRIRQMDQSFGAMQLTPEIVGMAVSLMIGLGLLTGAIPALQAMRINVISALQRN